MTPLTADTTTSIHHINTGQYAHDGTWNKTTKQTDTSPLTALGGDGLRDWQHKVSSHLQTQHWDEETSSSGPLISQVMIVCTLKPRGHQNTAPTTEQTEREHQSTCQTAGPDTERRHAAARLQGEHLTARRIGGILNFSRSHTADNTTRRLCVACGTDPHEAKMHLDWPRSRPH